MVTRYMVNDGGQVTDKAADEIIKEYKEIDDYFEKLRI